LGGTPEYEELITVIDLETQEECIVGKGVVPSWSSDGEWLAYTGADGIYIVRKDGTESQRVLEYCARCQETPSDIRWNKWPPLPEWSPDGKWLVYHREERGKYAIYRLNLETLEEVLIVEGGLNPDWRSTPVDASQE
jgi:Tol biopolymer transport system component